MDDLTSDNNNQKAAKTEKVWVNVTLQHKGQTKTYQVKKGWPMLALCKLNKEIPIEFDCLRADCGICCFSLKEGELSPVSESETDYLKAMGAGKNERLACQTKIRSDITIEVEDDWGP